MSVYGYSSCKEKTSFNIYFSTYETGSLTGNAFSKRFGVDLSKVIDVSDFQKSYKVYLTGESVSVNSGLPFNYCHFFEIKFGANNVNTYTNLITITPVFRISYRSYTRSTAGRKFDIKMNDNLPVIVNSLYGINYIDFNIRSIEGDNPVNTPPNYQMILHFEEIVD